MGTDFVLPIRFIVQVENRFGLLQKRAGVGPIHIQIFLAFASECKSPVELVRFCSLCCGRDNCVEPGRQRDANIHLPHQMVTSTPTTVKHSVPWRRYLVEYRVSKLMMKLI